MGGFPEKSAYVKLFPESFMKNLSASGLKNPFAT